MVHEAREPSAKYLVQAAFTQTAVGSIPADWRVAQLGQLADIRGGIAKNSNVTVADPTSVAYLSVANVQDGYLDLAELSTIEISRKDLARYSVLPGDVLMNEGGDLDKLGRGAIWAGQASPCVHQNHVFVVRCKLTLLPGYLNIWTSGAAARRYFLLAGKQTTNLASISKTSLGELPVAVPSAEEQLAIATALSDIDALLAGLDRLIAKKRDLKQAAMQQLLTGQTCIPGFHDEWKEARRVHGGERLEMAVHFRRDAAILCQSGFHEHREKIHAHRGEIDGKHDGVRVGDAREHGFERGERPGLVREVFDGARAGHFERAAGADGNDDVVRTRRAQRGELPLPERLAVDEQRGFVAAHARRASPCEEDGGEWIAD